MIAIDEVATVTVCLLCGRGFPPWARLSSRVDTLSTWWSGIETRPDGRAVLSGPPCNGQILAVSRRDQIHRVEAEKFLRGEQWTEEEIEKFKAETAPCNANG